MSGQDNAGSGQRFTLYYSPTSFYSQKALTTLYEKGVDFAHYRVDLKRSEQTEPWYVRMNPHGQVPVLKDGDKVIYDSENILQHMDTVVDQGTRLLPRKGDPRDSTLAQMHALLRDQVAIYISYGIFMNPSLSISGVKGPEEARLKKVEVFCAMGDRLRELAERHPDLRSVYLAKLEVWTERMAVVSCPDKVRAKIRELESVFDQLEACLAATQKDDPGAEWLCGREFRSADVIMTVLCQRMTVLGLEPRLFTPLVRPRVWDYWQRAKTRPSFLKVLEGAK